jgi:hypothetical protein
MPEIRRAIANAMKKHGQSDSIRQQFTTLFTNYVESNFENKDLRKMILAIEVPKGKEEE